MGIVTRGRVIRGVPMAPSTVRDVHAREVDRATVRVLVETPGDSEPQLSGEPREKPRDGRRFGRRMSVDELEARGEAARILLEAEARAEQLVRQRLEEAEKRAARDAENKLAGAYLHLRAAEERRAERDLDRSIALARLLAERLVRGELEQRPERIVAMARDALGEARGARRATLEACPSDLHELHVRLGELALPEGVIELRANAELARGSLYLHTDVGTLDARLSVQLDKLAAFLRENFPRTE